MANRTTDLLKAAVAAGLEGRDATETLDAIVRRCRAEGLSWDHAVAEVYAQSGVMISRQTLINWFAAEIEAELAETAS
ncbi:MAG: hypothetical protein AAGA65_23895 [Actinomycetota bacterium]